MTFHTHALLIPCSVLEPLPCPQEVPNSLSPLHNATPTLALVPAPLLQSASTDPKPSHSVQLYSMRSHTYVHSLSFNSPVLSLTCSRRLIAVALDAQIHVFNATTLQHTFSAVTYAVLTAMQSVKADASQARVTSPLALGSAWLAYASNQASPDIYYTSVCDYLLTTSETSWIAITHSSYCNTGPPPQPTPLPCLSCDPLAAAPPCPHAL